MLAVFKFPVNSPPVIRLDNIFLSIYLHFSKAILVKKTSSFKYMINILDLIYFIISWLIFSKHSLIKVCFFHSLLERVPSSGPRKYVILSPYLQIRIRTSIQLQVHIKFMSTKRVRAVSKSFKSVVLNIGSMAVYQRLM